MAKARAAICSTCRKNIVNVCSMCFCPIEAKTRSINTTCPSNKWPNESHINKTAYTKEEKK